VATVVAWVVPLLNQLTLPLEYLNTHIHELCHALAGILTGGTVSKINVYASGNGETLIAGGMLPIIGSAGYVGAALVGSLMILNLRTPGKARTSLKILCVVLALAMALFVRGDLVGITSGLAWAVGLWVMAAKLPDRAALFAAGFIGIQQCAHSVTSLLTLLQINAFTDLHNDALVLQHATGLPAMLWAIGWAAFGSALIFLGFKGAWRR
jgi:hypothetical protein